MRMTRMMSVGVAVLAMATTQVQASIVWDYSPATTGAIENGEWQNIAFAQNFAERIQFASGVSLTGMDVYSWIYSGSVGDSATIRLWSDDAGAPDTLLAEFSETISVIDTDGIGANARVDRKHVDFSNPLNLSAGTTYWIGMSGTNVEIALMSSFNANPPDDDMMAFFIDTTFLGHINFGDMSMRLYGDSITSTPEPATMALLGLTGLGGLGLRLRRNRKALAA